MVLINPTKIHQNHTSGSPKLRGQARSGRTDRCHCQKQYNYRQPLRVGLGGGIATPASAAAAFALGAEAVQIGSLFVATPESSAHQSFKNLIV